MVNKKILLVTLIAFVIMVMSPVVSAINVSFADPDATSHRDVYIYDSSGTLQGVYNTTSAGITVSGDSMFVIKPQYSNPLDDPGTFLTGIIGFIQTNAMSLIIIAALGGLLFKRW